MNLCHSRRADEPTCQSCTADDPPPPHPGVKVEGHMNLLLRALLTAENPHPKPILLCHKIYNTVMFHVHLQANSRQMQRPAL